MKKIFEWMREQMEKVKTKVYSPADVVWNNAVKMCLREVDEAEAKWETECTCKGCAYENDTSEETECGHCKRAYSDCYEPIKISEVE